MAESKDFYALARLGPRLVGVPLDWVDGALPLRSTLLNAPPRRQGALAGLAQTPQGLVPVAELSRWLPTPPPDPAAAADAAILLLRQGRRRIGVQMDRLAGVTRLGADRIQRLHHGEQPEELFDAVAAPGAGLDEPVHLLEPQRLMDLMASWHEDGSSGADADPMSAKADTGALGPGDSCAQFRSAGHWLAVPARHVGELIPMPALSQRWRGTGLSQGLSQWRGRPIAVLDAAKTLGIAPEPPGTQAPPWALVLHDGRRALLLPADEFAGLAPMPEQTHDEADTPGGPPRRRWIDPKLGQVSLLDVDELLTQLPESALADGGGERGAAGSAAADRLNARAFMVVQADQAYALPVADVQAVLPADPAQATRELVAWRGQQLPLRPLSLARPDEAPMVLVFDHEGRRQAWAIRRLIALVPARSATLSSWPGVPGGRLLTLQRPAASYPVLQSTT